MNQKSVEKERISLKLIDEKMNHIKRVFLKKNAEIKKILNGDFRLEHMLAAQREFEVQVKEFQGMIKIFVDR